MEDIKNILKVLCEKYNLDFVAKIEDKKCFVHCLDYFLYCSEGFKEDCVTLREIYPTLNLVFVCIHKYTVQNLKNQKDKRYIYNE